MGKSNELGVKLHESSLVLCSLRTQDSEEASLGRSWRGRRWGEPGSPGPQTGGVSARGGPSPWGGRRPRRRSGSHRPLTPPAHSCGSAGRTGGSLSGEEAGPPVSACWLCVSPGWWHLSPCLSLAVSELPSGLCGQHTDSVSMWPPRECLVFRRQPPLGGRLALPGPLWVAGHLSQVPFWVPFEEGPSVLPTPLKVLGSHTAPPSPPRGLAFQPRSRPVLSIMPPLGTSVGRLSIYAF